MPAISTNTLRQWAKNRSTKNGVSAAAEIMHSGEADNIDSAIERAAIELYNRDAEQAAVHREAPDFPEFDHEAAALDQADRYQGDEGAYYGDRSGAEEHVGPARGEIQPPSAVREEERTARDPV